jgi:hypothetical protein
MKPVLLVASVSALSLLLAGCGDSSKQSKAGTAISNAVTAPVEYLGAMGRAKTLAEKTVDLASVSQAIQMFTAQEGRYPKSLDELIEQQLLLKIPPAPYGMKIVYDPQTGRVSVVKDEPAPPSAPKK